MIYKFYDGAPDNTVQHVKYILPMIGNIKEFEVFRDYEASPYKSVEDGEVRRYTFILKDDNNNEFWFYTLCGYHGSGPNGTLKILQLLGLKEDYHICEEGRTHIKQKNLKPTHKLNLLVAQDVSANFSEDKEEYRFLATIDFRYAYQKNNFVKTLESFGYLQHVTPDDKGFFQKAYVFDGLDIPAYEYVYYTNNIFTFNRKFRDFSVGQVRTIIEEFVKINGGSFQKEFDI